MKKVLALALAVAMVLSIASVAFAAVQTVKLVYSVDSIDTSRFYKVKTKEIYLEQSGTVSYGNTIHYLLYGLNYDKNVDVNVPTTEKGVPLGINTSDLDEVEGALEPVSKYDAVKGVKIVQDWTLGSEWISKVDIVKKKSTGPGTAPYYYYLAVSIKSAATKSEPSDVSGEVQLKKTSGDNKVNRFGLGGVKTGETYKYAIEFEVRYVDNKNISSNLNLTIDENSRVFEFDTSKYDDAAAKVTADQKLATPKGVTMPDGLYQEDEETEFEFSKWEGATFTVNTYGQSKIVLKANTDYNSDIGAMYPDANLDFYNGNGSGFNKTGTMFIPAEEGSYIYEMKNGVLVAISSAEYDDYDEGFYFRTRTLGVYVVSDTELDLAAAPAVSEPGDGGISVVEPGDAPTIPVNPGTGAAA